MMFGSFHSHMVPTGCLIYPNDMNSGGVRFLNLTYLSQHSEKGQKHKLEMSEEQLVTEENCQSFHYMGKCQLMWELATQRSLRESLERCN